METIASITSLIPQRPPFVMIDSLIGQDEIMTRSTFLVKKDNIFVQAGKFAEAGLVEHIAQTAAARAGYTAALEGKPVKVGYIGAVKNLVVHSLPSVNEELVTTIRVIHQIFDAMILYGETYCNGKLVAECEMKIFIAQTK